MNPTVYTLASLEAMSDRELDAVVASVLFGETVSRAELPGGGVDWAIDRAMVPCYTAYWQGFGDIVERMQQLHPGWRFSLLGGDTDIEGEGFGWKAEWFGEADPRKNYGQRHGSARAETPFRAVAIAAVLAVQGAA
jgi:hypothetical protein